ncbi:CD206 [Mytilus edulis]|uniref:MRC n=1 Tax=Mytilus edulis TaxID=6550 RepID=A0A8S3TQL3_MYTED|nr:CD206 [Mytilus edulis]
MNSLVRSRIECYSKCALSDNCLSITYQDQSCIQYISYPSTVLPMNSLHYMIYKPWCDVYSGFIYVRYLNLCYIVISNSVHCVEAGQVCSQHSASIIEIDSQAKQEFIVNVIDNDLSISGIFIAGQITGGSWLRLDGTPLLYTNWDTRDTNNIQPNNRGALGECIGIESDYEFYWHDYEISYEYGVICEQRN